MSEFPQIKGVFANFNIDKTNKEALDIISNINKFQNETILKEVIDKYENGDFSTSLNLTNKLLAQINESFLKLTE